MSSTEKGAGEPYLNLQRGNSVVPPVAPHLIVHGCSRAISSRHVLDLTGAQVAAGVDSFQGAFGVDADTGKIAELAWL